MIRRFTTFPGHCWQLATLGLCPFCEAQAFRHFNGYVSWHPSQVDTLLKFDLKDRYHH